MSHGEAYRDSGLVFCKEDGTAIDPREFTKRFRRRLESAGLRKVRLHDLRHTHATLLLARGIPAKLVQEGVLVHAGITMTLELYSHVTPEMQKQAAESLNRLLTKSRCTKKTLLKSKASNKVTLRNPLAGAQSLLFICLKLKLHY
ncbi:MAG: Tyrosine recombinase XerC [Syntrophomonadaceae bacterium]|nr:Tyrosine recombinase XerC [Bacillota bacterium]